RGIKKLQRRIAEVEALDPKKLRYDAPQVRQATSNFHSDLIEIFTKQSQEYSTYYDHYVGFSLDVSSDPELRQRWFPRQLAQTVDILKGLIRRLEEKREDLGADPTARARETFEGLDLHPRIRDVAAELYRDGHYRNAVGDASIALVNYVKE